MQNNSAHLNCSVYTINITTNTTCSPKPTTNVRDYGYSKGERRQKLQLHKNLLSKAHTVQEERAFRDI